MSCDVVMEFLLARYASLEVSTHTYRKGKPAQLCGRGGAFARIHRHLGVQFGLLERLVNNGGLDSVEPRPLVLPAGSSQVGLQTVQALDLFVG